MMGIFTTGKSNRFLAISSFLHKYAGWTSIACYVLGIVTFCLFISDHWCEKTYFSDNALLPGLVNREFTLTSQSESLLKSLRQVASRSDSWTTLEWIRTQFQQSGLEAYDQNFTLKYPFGEKQSFAGRNVFAILRAGRAASTESIVLSAPFRTESSPHGSTLPSISLMISLARYFSVKNYWAKDIIFVVFEHELVGMQAWLNAYHDTKDQSIVQHSPLRGISGPIQAAVNLEINSPQLSRIDIKIEGLNGQLPNLDLFNVAVELCTRESVTPTFHGLSHPYAGPELDVWKKYATSTLSMMLSQGTTLPRGAHGLIQNFAIQAITLEGVERSSVSRSKQQAPVNLLHVGRVVEGIFRSLNNLLERFNRSYWFYLLPSTRRYLSIGYYMIPFALITFPLLLVALRIYLSDCRPSRSEGKEKTEKSPEVTLQQGIPYCFFAHVSGLVLLFIPYAVSEFGHLFHQMSDSTENVLYFTIISLCVLLIITPVFRPEPDKKSAIRVISLLDAALLFSAVSVMNISLAFVLTLVYTPVLTFIGSSGRGSVSSIKSGVARTLLLLVHPVSIHYYCLLGTSLYMNPEKNMMEHLLRSFSGHKKTILHLIEDWFIYGNWTYLLSTAFLFPAWFQTWGSV